MPVPLIVVPGGSIEQFSDLISKVTGVVLGVRFVGFACAAPGSSIATAATAAGTSRFNSNTPFSRGRGKAATCASACSDAHGPSPAATLTLLLERRNEGRSWELHSPLRICEEVMRALSLRRPGVPVARATRHRSSLSPLVFWFMSAVVAIQGGHVVEHVIQLFQVY